MIQADDVRMGHAEVFDVLCHRKLLHNRGSREIGLLPYIVRAKIGEVVFCR